MEERWEKIEDNMETIKGDMNEMMQLVKDALNQAMRIKLLWDEKEL